MGRRFAPLVLALAACGAHERSASGEVHASGPALGAFDLYPNDCTAATRGAEVPGGGQSPSVRFSLDDVTDEKLVSVLPDGQTTRTVFHSSDCTVFEVDVHVDGSVSASRYSTPTSTWGGSAHIACVRPGIGSIEAQVTYSKCGS